jgi:hypothetical protein
MSRKRGHRCPCPCRDCGNTRTEGEVVWCLHQVSVKQILSLTFPFFLVHPPPTPNTFVHSMPLSIVCGCCLGVWPDTDKIGITDLVSCSSNDRLQVPLLVSALLCISSSSLRAGSSLHLLPDPPGSLPRHQSQRTVVFVREVVAVKGCESRSRKRCRAGLWRRSVGRARSFLTSSVSALQYSFSFTVHLGLQALWDSIADDHRGWWWQCCCHRRGGSSWVCSHSTR